MAASKQKNKRLVKYVNRKIQKRFLAHIMFKVSSIHVCINSYSTVFSMVIILKNVSAATIVTGRITQCI